MAKKTAKARTDKQLLEALASDDYGIYSSAETELEDWFRANPEKALARATALGDLALTKAYEKSRTKTGYTVLPVLAAAVPKGKTLPAKWDPLVTAFGAVEPHRAVLATIPEARRTAIFVREVETGQKNTIGRIAEHLLDLAPDATTAILARAEKLGELRSAVKWGNLTKWTRKVPRVRQILEQFAKRAKAEPKPAPPPPKPAGSLTFSDPVVIQAKDYGKLDALRKAQYRIAAGAYLGGTVKDAAHFVRRLEADDMNEGDAEMRRWKVMQGGKHVYDLWVVWVDNGALFLAGEKKRAPAYLIQSSFLPIGKKPAAKALAEDLENSAPSDLWSVGKTTTKKKPAAKAKNARKK